MAAILNLWQNTIWFPPQICSAYQNLHVCQIAYYSPNLNNTYTHLQDYTMFCKMCLSRICWEEDTYVILTVS